MQYIILILSIMGIHILAWLTPGPIMILILRNSLLHSRRAGIWTNIGSVTGNVIHISYSILGISILISTSTLAFNIIKYLGAAYLTFLGIKTLLVKPFKQDPVEGKTQQNISRFAAAKMGFLTNILSPKASLFFISIFAVVFATTPPLWVPISLAIIMTITSLIMGSSFAILFTQKRVMTLYSNYQNVANKILGIVLILLALIIAFYKV